MLEGHKDGVVTEKLCESSYDEWPVYCREFSGGWRMRLALARALFSKYDTNTIIISLILSGSVCLIEKVKYIKMLYMYI